MASDHSVILVNLANNKVLYEQNSHETRYPASLTKMMTLYVAFMALNNGSITWQDQVHVSAKAAKQAKTRLNLRPGQKISVEDLIRSIIIVSANDSSVALAEYVSGSEEKYVQHMNHVAKELGMDSTLFQNVHGLHNASQHTTARDISKLAIALRRDFPEYYKLFSMKNFVWNNQTYPTHNLVNVKYPWANGLKTGYIGASGYNIASTASKDGDNILVVVMHTKNKSARDQYTIDMLEYGFEHLKYYRNHNRYMAN